LLLLLLLLLLLTTRIASRERTQYTNGKQRPRACEG
jgi:hypothetical protein